MQLTVAGRTHEKILDPLPNQKAEFEWDGLDYLNRVVTGATTAHIEIGFVYSGVYQRTDRFGYDGNMVITGSRTRQEVILWRKKALTVYSTGQIIAGGWTLSSHHFLNPANPNILYKGDGTIIRNNVYIIDTVAGNGTAGYSGDGGPANEAKLNDPDNMFVDASGNLYIADTVNHRIRKVDSSGIITTVAGNGTEGYSGDEGPHPWRFS